MELDIKSNLTFTTLIASGTHSADAKGTPINIAPYIGNVVFHGDFGAPYVSPNATAAVYIQTTGTVNPDSLQAPSETAWAAAGTFATAAAAATAETISLDTRGLSKWVRTNLDMGGLGTSFRPLSVTMIGQKSVV